MSTLVTDKRIVYSYLRSPYFWTLRGLRFRYENIVNAVLPGKCIDELGYANPYSIAGGLFYCKPPRSSKSIQYIMPCVPPSLQQNTEVRSI